MSETREDVTKRAMRTLQLIWLLLRLCWRLSKSWRDRRRACLKRRGPEITDEMVKRAAAEFFYWAKRDPDSPSGYEPAMRKALEVVLSDA